MQSQTSRRESNLKILRHGYDKPDYEMNTRQTVRTLDRGHSCSLARRQTFDKYDKLGRRMCARPESLTTFAGYKCFTFTVTDAPRSLPPLYEDIQALQSAHTNEHVGLDSDSGAACWRDEWRPRYRRDGASEGRTGTRDRECAGVPQSSLGRHL